MRIKKIFKPVLFVALAVCMMCSLMKPLPAHALGIVSHTGLGGGKTHIW